MQIAVVQMEVFDGNPEENRRVLAEHLDKNLGSDLYLVPELWTTGYVQEQWEMFAVEDSPASLLWMSNQAKSRHVWLGGSIIAVNSEGFLVNRFFLFNRDGVLSCSYDKAHLFRPLEEHIYLKSGEVLPPVVDVEGLWVSPAICYDLRFPEMFRRMALKGVDVFLVSSEWPFPRQHPLRVLTEARAIENQVVVALANRVGMDNQGNNFCGGSGVFGPLGPLAEITDTAVAVADVNIEELHKMRLALPVMKHRMENIDYD